MSAATAKGAVRFRARRSLLFHRELHELAFRHADREGRTVNGGDKMCPRAASGVLQMARVY
jgi:hypothetical protein